MVFRWNETPIFIIIHMQIKTTQTMNFLLIFCWYFGRYSNEMKTDLSQAARNHLFTVMIGRFWPSLFSSGRIDICYCAFIINSQRKIFFRAVKILNDGLKMIYKTLELCKFFHSAKLCNYPCGFLLLFRPHADHIQYDF